MKNDDLYEKALDVINDLFYDQSVSSEQAKNNLENLKEEIDLLIDTLKDEYNG